MEFCSFQYSLGKGRGKKGYYNTGYPYLVTYPSTKAAEQGLNECFSSLTSPRVFSYRCVLHYFLTLPVGFNFNLTYGLKPQVRGIKIVTVYRRSIFQVEWLIASLNSEGNKLCVYNGGNCNERLFYRKEVIYFSRNFIPQLPWIKV